MSNELQSEPWVLFGAKSALPSATGAGMEEGYFYYAKDTRQLYVIALVLGVRTWVPAAAAATPTAVLLLPAPGGSIDLTALGFAPLLSLISLRVAGGPAPGVRVLSDDGAGSAATPAAGPAPGVAVIDAAGNLITFEAPYAAVFIQYTPRLP